MIPIFFLQKTDGGYDEKHVRESHKSKVASRKSGVLKGAFWFCKKEKKPRHDTLFF